MWDCIPLLRQEVETSVFLMHLRSREKNALKWSDLNYIEVLWAPRGKKSNSYPKLH
jgi:hypothetical protein